MAIAIVLILVFIVTGAALTAPVWVSSLSEVANRRKTKKLQAKQKQAIASGAVIQRPKMSNFANHILDEFCRLPKDNRPFGVQEFIDSLVALDVKHGIDDVSLHFTTPGPYNSSRFTTNCTSVYNYYTTKHRPHDCKYTEYKDLLNAIHDIQEAIAKQERAHQLSAVQHNLDDVKTFTEALRGESVIVNTVTKEMY